MDCCLAGDDGEAARWLFGDCAPRPFGETEFEFGRDMSVFCFIQCPCQAVLFSPHPPCGELRSGAIGPGKLRMIDRAREPDFD